MNKEVKKFRNKRISNQWPPMVITEQPQWWSNCSSVVKQSNKVLVGLAVLKPARPGPSQSGPRWNVERKWTGNLFGGQGTAGDRVFYHLWITVTVGFRVGAWGDQGGGQCARVGGDVVFIVFIWLGRSLRVTAGKEVGASPGHSRFLFRARAAHLLSGNHRNIRSATYRLIFFSASLSYMYTCWPVYQSTVCLGFDNGDFFLMYTVELVKKNERSKQDYNKINLHIKWGSARVCVCPTSLCLDPPDLELSLYMARDLSWFIKSLSDLQHRTRSSV